MLLNVGSETNEVAFRLAKSYTGRFEIVGLTRAYHGLLAGTGSVTFTMGHKGYGPLMPGSHAIPAPYEYRCPIRHCCGTCDTTCLDVGFETVDQASVGSLAAMVVEPVLSTGGIIPLPEGYLARAKEKCEERGMLLIVDEAQTGFGRTGDMFGFERDGIVPDILTVSKTLGGGAPLGATITSAEIEQRCVENGFLHLTTHVSDPMPAAAGLAVLDVLEEERLPARAATMGAVPAGAARGAAGAPRGDRRRARTRAARRASSWSPIARRRSRPARSAPPSPPSACGSGSR